MKIDNAKARILFADTDDHLIVLDFTDLLLYSRIVMKCLNSKRPYMSFSWIMATENWYENNSGRKKETIEDMVGLVPITYYNYIK